MEWLTCVRAAIDYMEAHLQDDISAQDIAERVYVSPFFLQRGFSLTTGCGLGEYLRSRRLYQAVFDCVGPIPEALQSLNTRIFREWLPGNPDYELSGSASVEWYDSINGEKTDPDYHSAIWIPVRKK